MENLPSLLFCRNPLEPTEVDPDFNLEFFSAAANGFSCNLVDFDALVSDGNANSALRKLKAANSTTNIIYRRWMLTPFQYAQLYDGLLERNYILVNTPEEYQNCHYLPDSLKFIQGQTPETIFQPIDGDHNLASIVELASVFGSRPVIIKDYVKSEKHDWETACFVPDASNTSRLTETINNFLKLRGKYLNVGIVIREFVSLRELATHSLSGMPLKEEYRLFFLKGKLLGVFDYWEEGDYGPSEIDTSAFEELAATISSNFFSMDIARKVNGEFIIIELGDGQVSGLPESVDLAEFYRQIKRCWS